eukprot:TCONS_00033400-protein
MKIDVEQELRDLGPQVIDPKNCTPKLSLHQQILNTPKARLLKEQSKQWFCYYDKKSIAVLDYNIDERMKLTLDNLKQESPEYWFTKELDAFLQTQALNNEIKQDEFNKWTVNLMTLYLMKRE